VVKQENVKIPRFDLDQVHLPDPVLADIRQLKAENEELRSMVEKLAESINK